MVNGFKKVFGERLPLRAGQTRAELTGRKALGWGTRRARSPAFAGLVMETTGSQAGFGFTAPSLFPSPAEVLVMGILHI